MENEGQIITVSGPIDPAEAGITLMHEHMLFAGFWLFDYSAWVDSEGQSGFDEPLRPGDVRAGHPGERRLAAL